jgi:hypothetical protein
MHNLCFQFLVLKIEAIHEEFQTCKNCIINSQIVYGFINDFSAKKTISSPSVSTGSLSTTYLYELEMHIPSVKYMN